MNKAIQSLNQLRTSQDLFIFPIANQRKHFNLWGEDFNHTSFVICNLNKPINHTTEIVYLC